MLVYWGGISGADATHLCTFDIPLIKNIPNMVYLAPTSKEELTSMLNWSVEQTKYPVAIRMPNTELHSYGPDNTDYSVLNKYKVTQNGEKVAILGLGNFYELALKVSEQIQKTLGFKPTIINPRFITGVDKELMERLKTDHKLVITLEDGLIDGGFGEMIARFYGNSDMRVLNYGALKEFTDRTPLDELYTRYRIKPELILEDIKNLI
jgi:1-deoxy-D-xylulose-5-phosphate synthase